MSKKGVINGTFLFYSPPYDMNVTLQSYAACLITSQGKISEDLAKSTFIKKGPCVVVAQELECILDLNMPSLFLGNCYSHRMCGDFIRLELSSEYILVLYQQYFGIIFPILLYG